MPSTPAPWPANDALTATLTRRRSSDDVSLLVLAVGFALLGLGAVFPPTTLLNAVLAQTGQDAARPAGLVLDPCRAGSMLGGDAHLSRRPGWPLPTHSRTG